MTVGRRSWAWFVRAVGERFLALTLALVAFLPLVLVCLVARCRRRQAVGLGPEPLINNVHHARALRLQGYDAVTFVSHLYFVTAEFDVRWLRAAPLNHYALFCLAVLRCRIVYIYFNGGPLAWTGLWAVEPLLYRLAGTRVVVMPYGGDVQDFAVHDDVVYRSAYLVDYPEFIRTGMQTRRKQVRRWMNGADWIISGCDWVHYTPYWDTLMLAHFSVDTDRWSPGPDWPPAARTFVRSRPLRVLHAPNHRAIKGTRLVEGAVDELRAAGIPIELVVVQKVANAEIVRLVREVDVVVEQLVIGWYGIFGVEAMAAGKPVLTYIDQELERLYVMQGLLEPGELPVLRVDHDSLREVLKSAASGEIDLPRVAAQSRAFVDKHHSLAAVGNVLAGINTALGLPRPTVNPVHPV